MTIFMHSGKLTNLQQVLSQLLLHKFVGVNSRLQGVHVHVEAGRVYINVVISTNGIVKDRVAEDR